MSVFQAQSSDAAPTMATRVQSAGGHPIIRRNGTEQQSATGDAATVRREIPAPIKRGVTEAPVHRATPDTEAAATAPVRTEQPIEPIIRRAPAPVRIATGEPVGAPSEADVELVSVERFFGKLEAITDGEKPKASELGLFDVTNETKIGSKWAVQILGHVDHKMGWFIPLTIRNVAVEAASEQQPAKAPRARAERFAPFTSTGTRPAARAVINTGNSETAKAPRATGKPSGRSTKRSHGLGLAALAELLPGSDSHDSV